MHCGEDAIELLASDTNFDAILSDLNMPDITGIELHRRIKTRFPAIVDRVAFMTGGLPPAARAHDKDKVACIEKPFTIQQLRAFLKTQGMPLPSQSSSI